MAGELQITNDSSGITAYAFIRNGASEVWNGSAYVTFVDANIATYVVTLAQQGTVSRCYVGDMPAGAASAAKSIEYRMQVGGSSAITDPRIGTETYVQNSNLVQWKNSVPGSLADTDKIPASVQHMATDSLSAAAMSTGAADQVADHVWDESSLAHVGVNSFGALIAAIKTQVDANGTAIEAVQNNTRVVRVVPQVIERPDSGTQEYRIELLLYDEVGNMEAPDSAPTIALVDQGGTDLSARLDSATMSLVSTGRYRAVYTASDDDDLEQLVWAFSVVEGGNTRIYGNTTLIVDTTAVDFTSSDRTKLNALHDDRLTAARAGYLDKLNVSGTLAHSDAANTYKADVTNVTVGTNNDKTGYSISGTLTTFDAIWAKIKKWLQLMIRSDAAIATDNATELGEINANGGAGAGDYDNTTNSLEAGASGGGDCDPDEIAQAVANLLAGEEITVRPVVDTNGNIRLIRNFDYHNADGRAPAFSKSTYPVLTSGSVRLTVLDKTDGTKVIDALAGTISAARACYFDIDKEDTDGLTIGNRYRYQVEATLAGGNDVPLEQGDLEIQKNYSDGD